jgi:predicted ferric reductase
MEVYLEGPYGALSVDFYNAHLYKGVLLVAGGVGITAVLPLWNALVLQAKSLKGPRKMRLAWVARDSEFVNQTFHSRMASSTLSITNPARTIEVVAVLEEGHALPCARTSTKALDEAEVARRLHTGPGPSSRVILLLARS